MRQKPSQIAFIGLIAFAFSPGWASGPTGEQRDRWADAMAAFQRQDAANPPPADGILFVGSSSIRLWDLRQSFPDAVTINRGFGGSQISDSIKHFDLLVAKHRPRIVVFYAGDNDVAVGKSAEQVHRDYRKFREKLRTSLPETELLYIAVKPSIARWRLAKEMRAANGLIAADCKKDRRAAFVDVWTPMLGEDGRPRAELFVDDGLHLNKTGFQLWAELLRPHLKPDADDAP